MTNVDIMLCCIHGFVGTDVGNEVMLQSSVKQGNNPLPLSSKCTTTAFKMYIQLSRRLLSCRNVESLNCCNSASSFSFYLTSATMKIKFMKILRRTLMTYNC